MVTAANGLLIKTARLDKSSHDLQRLLNASDLEVERYLTSGSLHRTRQDKGPHMLPVITVKLSFILPQIHPHHLPISRFFPKDPQNSWGPQNNKIGISLVHLKYPLKHEKIWTRSSRSLDLTSLVKTG